MKQPDLRRASADLAQSANLYGGHEVVPCHPLEQAGADNGHARLRRSMQLTSPRGVTVAAADQ